MSSLSYLSYLTIDLEHVLCINGDPSISVRLPSVSRDAIEVAVFDLTEQHSLDTISDDTVSNCIIEAMANYRTLVLRSVSKSVNENKKSYPKAAIELTDYLTREISLSEIDQILSTSIKQDSTAKQITFLAMLLSQTNSSQINVGFQAESSAGKSYVPIELSNYFPESDVSLIASASPTAFFHDKGQPVYEEYETERGEKKQQLKHILVNLEGKILVFLDMPGWLLMEKLRPLLSHDRKVLHYKITDRTANAGIRTKNVQVVGYPCIIFCSAKLESDEQERTRLILLSPSVDKSKLEESIRLSSLKNCDPIAYKEKVESDPNRKWLRDRILAIRQSGVREVKIPEHETHVLERFLDEHEHLKARHQRDFPRIISLIKGHALLNLFNRKRQGDTVEANAADIDAGFKLYAEVQDSNDLGISPYVYRIFQKVIEPHYDEALGLDFKRIQKHHYTEFHKSISSSTLGDILAQLEAASLVDLAKDDKDKRKTLVFKPS